MVVVGFLGPVTIASSSGCSTRRSAPCTGPSRSAQSASGPTASRSSTGRPGSDRPNWLQPRQLHDGLHRPGFQKVLINTALWVILVPLLATAFGLIYAVLVDRTRFEKAAKALIFLPMAISMVGASIIWKFVYEYRQAGRQSDRPGQPDPGLARPGAVPVPAHRTVEHLLPDRGDDLDPGGLRDDGAVGGDQGGPRRHHRGGPDRRRDRLQAVPQVTVPTIRPAVVVVLTTIAMGTLKAFDIVRTMTGGNFGTSVVANEFYTQTFRRARAASASVPRSRSSCSSSSFRSSSTTSGRCASRRRSDEHVRLGARAADHHGRHARGKARRRGS